MSWGLLTQNGCKMYSSLHLFAHPQRSHSDLFELRSLIVRFRKYIILCSDPFTSTSPQSAFQVPNKQINIFQEEKILQPNRRDTRYVSGRHSRAFHQHSNHTVNHKQPNVFRNVAGSKGHVSSTHGLCSVKCPANISIYWEKQVKGGFDSVTSLWHPFASLEHPSG